MTTSGDRKPRQGERNPGEGHRRTCQKFREERGGGSRGGAAAAPQSSSYPENWTRRHSGQACSGHGMAQGDPPTRRAIATSQRGDGGRDGTDARHAWRQGHWARPAGEQRAPVHEPPAAPVFSAAASPSARARLKKRKRPHPAWGSPVRPERLPTPDRPRAKRTPGSRAQRRGGPSRPPRGWLEASRSRSSITSVAGVPTVAEPRR